MKKVSAALKKKKKIQPEIKQNVCSVTQSCLTLCDSMDCSPPGSSVHGIFQARILRRVAIFFSWGSSRPKETILCLLCLLYPCDMQTIIISEKCPPIAERALFDGEGESRKEEILDFRQILLNL